MINHDSEADEEVDESDSFDLVAPATDIKKYADRGKRPDGGLAPPKPRAKNDDTLKDFAWKGFEEQDDVDPDPPVGFSAGKKNLADPNDGMDMTPMVDVTFLLLIFFMVTASFSVQKSLETPHSKVEDASTVFVEPEPSDEFVEVIIDQTNTYYVTTRGEGEVEAASDRDMAERIRAAKNEFNAIKLTITAHVDSLHGKVVTAWDSGIAAGFEKIEIRTTELNY
jgi:biopolymer transport protein ExbD